MLGTLADDRQDGPRLARARGLVSPLQRSERNRSGGRELNPGRGPIARERGPVHYVIEYTIRTTGLSHDQNLVNQEALLKTFGKWNGEEGLRVTGFLSRLNLTGGYVIVEADDPGAVTSFVSKFSYWNDVEVVPVVAVEEAVGTATESLAWTRNALNG
jgi:hypothetical protein